MGKAVAAGPKIDQPGSRLYRDGVVKILLIALGVVILLWLTHRLLLSAEHRGWIFYRHRPPRVRFTGLLEELVQPSVEYLIEEQSSEAITADHADSGQGPPEEVS